VIVNDLKNLREEVKDDDFSHIVPHVFAKEILYFEKNDL